MNPNLQAVANGASSRLILNPDPLLGVCVPDLCFLFTMYDSGFGKRQDNYVRRKAQCQRKAAADRNTDDKQLCVPSDFCLWQKDLVRL